jgi:hypothetical protein
MAATVVEADAAYLAQFEQPLWEVLGLDAVRPVMVVEGRQDGFDYVVLELEHTASLLGERVRRVGTFFVLRLPYFSAGRPIHAELHGWEASASGRFLYLGRADRRPGPAGWRAALDIAVDAARSIPLAPRGRPRVESVRAGPYEPGTWSWQATAWLLFALFNFAVAFGVLTGLLEADNRLDALPSIAVGVFGLFGTVYYLVRGRAR